MRSSHLQVVEMDEADVIKYLDAQEDPFLARAREMKEHCRKSRTNANACPDARPRMYHACVLLVVLERLLYAISLSEYM